MSTSFGRVIVAFLSVLVVGSLPGCERAPLDDESEEPATGEGESDKGEAQEDEAEEEPGTAKPQADAGRGNASSAGKDAGAPKPASTTDAGKPGASTPATDGGKGGPDTTGAADAGAPASSSPFPQLPRVESTDGPGPFKEVVKVKSTPPGGWLIYPKDLGKDGMKHPIFVFGPGGGTTPSTYESMGMHWDRYGSYGFVIYVLPQSTGDGAPMKAGLDWLLKQNDDMASPLYQKLDTSKICAAGHSQGSVTTFAFLPDERVTTSIHISGGSGGRSTSRLNRPAMYIAAPDSSGDPGKPNADKDFDNTKVPVYYGVIAGSDHLTSGRLAWGAVIAWMLWHLAGQEDQWRKEFMEPTGKFQTGIYTAKTKNW